MKLILRIYLSLIFVIILPGCAPAGSAITQTREDFQTSSPTSIPPTQTLTPFLPTFTVTPLPTQTATLTPPATFEPEQARNLMQTWLKEPSCLPPCFWGIIPGKTTLGEAKNIFTQLGLDLVHTYTESNDEFYSLTYELDSGLQATPMLVIQDEIVKNMQVGLEPANSSREWSAYSPKGLIKRYGLPSKVYFVIDRGPRILFVMDMYFDSLDLIVEYVGYNTLGGTIENPRACPLTDPVEYVRLWMGKEPYSPPRFGVPLEKATSMTIEEFSKLMTGNPSKACFTLNGEAFP